MGLNVRYSPLEWDEKLKIYNFGGYGATGLLLEALTTTGNVFYVDNSNKQAFNGYGDVGRSPSKPLQSVDWAIGRCTANNGDIIIVMPGHAENVSSASAITCDIAGVKIIGVGEGAARPTFTWNSTDNSATWAISAASVGIYNILGVCGDDGLTKAFYVTGADCTIDITWRDPAGVEAARCVLGGTGADRIKVRLKYEGDAATGNACVAPVQLNGTDEGDIEVNFFGIASTAVVNFITTSCTGIRVKGFFYNEGTTDLSKNVVDTIGTSQWSVNGFDGSAGCWFSGGDNTTVAKDDLSVVASDLVVTQSDVKAVQSNLTIVDTVADKISSDLIVTQSDVKVVISDWATFTTQVSDLTTGVSDLTKQVSDLTIAVSDFIVISSDIGSDLTAIEADTAKTSSDLIIVQSDLKIVQSDLIVTNAIVDTIASDLILVDAVVDGLVTTLSDVSSDVHALETDTISIASDLVIVQSDLKITQSDVKAIGSDLIVTNAIIDVIASDLVAVNNRCITIASDLVAFRTAWGTFETIMSDFVVQYASDQVADRAYLSDMWSDIKSDVA